MHYNALETQLGDLFHQNNALRAQLQATQDVQLQDDEMQSFVCTVSSPAAHPSAADIAAKASFRTNRDYTPMTREEVQEALADAYAAIAAAVGDNASKCTQLHEHNKRIRGQQ